tara:strand:- start:780 stop:1922 length:1143 start_codon:yes stop_codon:yes gene_type:complete
MGLFVKERQKGTYWYYVKRPDIKSFSTKIKWVDPEKNQKAFERSRALAQKVVDEKLEQRTRIKVLNQAQNVDLKNIITIKKACFEFGVYQEKYTKKGKNTKKRYVSSLNKFVNSFGNKKVYDQEKINMVMHYDIKKYFEKLSEINSFKTLKEDNLAIRLFYEWCQTEGYYPIENTIPNQMSIKHIKELNCKGRKIHHHPISNKNFAKLISEEKNPNYKNFFKMLFYTGLNFIDIKNLDETNIIDEKLVVKRHKEDKHNREENKKKYQIIPLHPAIKNINFETLRFVSIKHLRNSLQKKLNGMQEDGSKPHNHSTGDNFHCLQCFRHTFSTNMDAILEKEKTKLLTGHAPREVIDRYIHNNQTKKPIDPEIVEAVHSLPHF